MVFVVWEQQRRNHENDGAKREILVVFNCKYFYFLLKFMVYIVKHNYIIAVII